MSKPGRARRMSAWRWGVLVVLGIVAGSLWTPYPAQLVRVMRGYPEPRERIIEKRVEVPVEVRVEVPVPVDGKDKVSQIWKPQDLIAPTDIKLPPFPPVLPENLSTGTFEQYTSLTRGLRLRSIVNFIPGSTASQDREKKQAYQIRICMELFLPRAAGGKELLHANPKLPRVLANYFGLMEHAQVSHWFNSLYLHKQNRVRRSLASLSQPLDKHNFYDTDTILRITAPNTERKVLWLQADMDVVSDGSDGDRLPEMPENIRNSENYQPSTSYRWKKRGTVANPLLPGWEARLERLLKEKPRRAAAIDNARRIVWDLKHYSYLLAQYDPFIVIPLTLKEGQDDAFRPELGDYVIVLVGNKAYPAIVGDYGPRHKAGEASLRLGKLINPRAGIYARPISALSASYIIFPHSGEPENGPIDYKRLNSRCRELLDEIGGIGPDGQFVEIEDLLAPKEPEGDGGEGATGGGKGTEGTPESSNKTGGTEKDEKTTTSDKTHFESDSAAHRSSPPDKSIETRRSKDKRK